MEKSDKSIILFFYERLNSSPKKLHAVLYACTRIFDRICKIATPTHRELDKYTPLRELDLSGGEATMKLSALTFAHLYLSLLLVVFNGVDSVDSNSSQRIVFAVDRRDRLNPAHFLKNTHRLFDVRYIDNANDFTSGFDLVVFANWTRLNEMHRLSQVEVPSYVANEVGVMELFEDKAKWKAWMTNIDLGSYVPVTYNQTESVGLNDFPVMLKTNQHFGRGAHPIADKEQLAIVAANMAKQGLSYTLEEALTGMPLTEFGAFGSVFKGKLLSLRCNSRSFEASAARKSAAFSHSNPLSESPLGLFVHGFKLKHKEEHYVPCSRELVRVLATMFTKAETYTGPFCADLKLDKQMRPKLMEINARYCGTLHANDFLFVTTFVPLAAAVHNFTKTSTTLQHQSAFEHSIYKDELEHIVGDERYALATGGGMYQGKWRAFDTFNGSARLDDLNSTHSYSHKHRRHRVRTNFSTNTSSNTSFIASSSSPMRVYSQPSFTKITFGVDLSPGLNPSSSLHSSASLFDFRILSQLTDLTPDIDLIVHANYTALTALVQQQEKANVSALPGYIANDQTTLDLFNDKGHWKAWMQEIGLGAYVPHTYDQRGDVRSFDYPLMLKTNQHFGHGVYVINSPEHLRNVSGIVKQSGYAYTLEEALTGMGLSEVGTYGSAYKGKLLSLRCVIRTFSASQTVRTGDPTKKNALKSREKAVADVFVRGFMMKSGEQAVLPCSAEIAQVTRKMLSQTSYTGPFCSSIKSDKLFRPKMLEINARFCGPMAVTDALFIATFVPLSVAHHLALSNPKSGNKNSTKGTSNWYKSSRIFAHIAEVERKVVETGGGMMAGQVRTVERFDPALRVNQIGYERIDGFKVPHLYNKKL